MGIMEQQTGQGHKGSAVDVTFRPARADEVGTIAEIMFSEPPKEAVRVCGGVERARRFCYMQVSVPEVGQGWERTVFALLDDQPVTVLQAGKSSDVRITPRLAWNTVRILGALRTFRSLPYLRALRRVTPTAPEGSYYIAELHTHPDHRNKGLGKAALEYAEERARDQGAPLMSLVTTVVNPARHLYERQGFRVVETRTDVEYERLTGIPGRNLMVKELS